jgi:hypothetical protein
MSELGGLEMAFAGCLAMPYILACRDTEKSHAPMIGAEQRATPRSDRVMSWNCLPRR